LGEPERNQFTIQHDHGATTIARVTCPTAPKFWRWRDLPFPKVVQRDVEFLEHADDDHGHHHADEWKWQLALAIACGALGLLAAYARAGAWRIPVFILSYLAGAWFPAEEVWERLRQRAIDVHFLMLAVAAGSASIGAWGEGATLLFLFSLVWRAGALRVGPDAKGNPLALSRRAEDGDGAGCTGQRDRSQSRVAQNGNAVAGEARLAIPGGRGGGERSFRGG
jgi:hypothetical protein